MTGTASQIEWAELIRPRVEAEFRRVAAAFEAVAQRQSEAAANDTRAILSILEAKRAEVMAHEEAGYFIRYWQDLKDQVRQMIQQDVRYPEIQARRIAHTTQACSNDVGQI